VDDFRLKQQAFCILNLKNESEIDLGSTTIRLLNVATGPYHHDLAVSWKSQLTAQKVKFRFFLEGIGFTKAICLILKQLA